MPRNKNGFLKRDALRAGVPEQYATFRDHALCVVEIIERPGDGIVFQERKTYANEADVAEQIFGDDLKGARELFRKKVRALGGRA